MYSLQLKLNIILFQAQNRFKVPVGTKFYRVKAKSWKHDASESSCISSSGVGSVPGPAMETRDTNKTVAAGQASVGQTGQSANIQECDNSDSRGRRQSSQTRTSNTETVQAPITDDASTVPDVLNTSTKSMDTDDNSATVPTVPTVPPGRVSDAGNVS